MSIINDAVNTNNLEWLLDTLDSAVDIHHKNIKEWINRYESRGAYIAVKSMHEHIDELLEGVYTVSQRKRQKVDKEAKYLISDRIKDCFEYDREHLEKTFNDCGCHTVTEKTKELLGAMGLSKNDTVICETDDDTELYECLVGAFFSGCWKYGRVE